MSVTRIPHAHRGAERLAWGMVGFELAVGLVMSLAGNPEGWWGGVIFGVLYAAPVAVLLWLLRSRRPGLSRAAGLVAVPLAFAYIALPIANWTGYRTGWEEARALLATIPVAIACFAIFVAGFASTPPRRTTHSRWGRRP